VNNRKEQKLKLTFTYKATLDDLVITNDNDMLFREVDNVTWMEEGSSGQGNLAGGNTKQYFKDTNMLDGDACRPDGTLKDASEILFLNSPSEAPVD
jgi:hypothetical protein